MWYGDPGPVLSVIAWALTIAGSLPCLYLGLLALAAYLPGRSASQPFASNGKIAVVIPAHNEQLLIAETVRLAQQQEYPRENYQIVVVADNCSDDTAALARSEGARVIERHDRPGKGQALDTAFKTLLTEDWDAVLVMDADTHMHPQLLAELASQRSMGEHVVQVRYGVLNPEESWRTSAMELALASFNALRPKGKNGLRQSAGLFGNGFMLSRQVLEQVPYLAGSIVEDLEYHLQLLRAGFQVRFVDRVWVKAQMPATAADSRSQRVRWERGRMSLIRLLVPGLLKEVLRGRRYALEALIDVCMPPVSVPVLLLMPAFLFGSSAARIVVLGALAALFLHYGVAALRYGSPKRLLLVMLHVPWYLVWKTWAVATSMLSRAHLPWVRTRRH